MVDWQAQRKMEEIREKLNIWNRQPKEVDSLVYKGCATGLSFHNYNVYATRIKKDDRLIVQAVRDNPFDPKATGLFFVDALDGNTKRQIGWIPKALNSVASDRLLSGYELDAVVTKNDPCHYDPQKRLMVEVRIKALPNTLISSNPSTVTVDKPTKETTMSKVQQVIATNMQLSTSAAFLEAGRIANNQISNVAASKLPMLMRGYAATPLGRLIIANIAALAAEHFRADDKRLKQLTNAMTVSAYQELLQTLDIEQFIEDLVSNSTIKKALKTFDAEAKAEA